MNPSQICSEYEKMMKTITKVRTSLFDCVEIPHLMNYYEGGDQQLSLSTDLYLVREAEKYISQNLCMQYSSDISRQVSEQIELLLQVKKQFDKLNQQILKQHRFSAEKNTLSVNDKENMLNTIVVQNSVIEEYFNSKPIVSST